jgi:hypothetical protein
MPACGAPQAGRSSSISWRSNRREPPMTDERQATAAAMRALCTWAAATDLRDIPEPVLARAAQVLADDLSVIIGARDEPQVARFHDRFWPASAAPRRQSSAAAMRVPIGFPPPSRMASRPTGWNSTRAIE